VTDAVGCEQPAVSLLCNNLRVVAQQRNGRASNPRLLDRKSDALPLTHRATPVSEDTITLVLRDTGSTTCVVKSILRAMYAHWRSCQKNEDKSDVAIELIEECAAIQTTAMFANEKKPPKPLKVNSVPGWDVLGLGR